MSILEVLSNLKHNGTDYKPGEFIQEDAANFESLIADGIVRVIDGAESLEEAKEVVEQEKIESMATESQEVSVEPQDTWGPVKDEVTTEPVAPVEPKNEPTDEVVEKTENVSDTTENSNVEAVSGENKPEETQKTVELETGDNL